jgi:hypothetical protein
VGTARISRDIRLGVFSNLPKVRFTDSSAARAGIKQDISLLRDAQNSRPKVRTTS